MNLSGISDSSKHTCEKVGFARGTTGQLVKKQQKTGWHFKMILSIYYLNVFFKLPNNRFIYFLFCLCYIDKKKNVLSDCMLLSPPTVSYVYWKRTPWDQDDDGSSHFSSRDIQMVLCEGNRQTARNCHTAGGIWSTAHFTIKNIPTSLYKIFAFD